MKKTILFSSALVALAMLASCQKEEFIETPATATGVTEFTATIESTKTTIATDGKVTWTAGDEIIVTDAASKSAVYEAVSAGATTTFTLKQGDAVGAGPYKATYGDITKQKYKANAAGANCPLTAQSSTTNFTFSSPYAVLKITAKSSGREVIKKVVVKYGNSNSVLDCEGQNVTLTSDGVAFYVAVQPSTEAATLSVTFYNTANMMAKKTRNGSISLDAKDLLPVKFGSLDFNTPTPTFKAVYDDTNKKLTFYYDNANYTGTSITVFEDGTNLFDDSKSNGAKWGYDDKRNSIESVEISASVKDYPFLTSTAYMFQGMTAASSISGAEHLDVSNVTDMTHMFSYFGKDNITFNAVPIVREWNTGNVKNMANLFNSYGISSTNLATPPDVSEWDTGNVTDMGYMFSGYGKSSTSLTAVPNVSGWKTDKVTNTKNLFSSYGGETNNINCVLDLTGWNLANLAASNNVFNNFSPKTFEVTIPAKTGTKQNYANKWYYGPNGATGAIAPPSGKKFSDENGSPLPDEPTQSN